MMKFRDVHAENPDALLGGQRYRESFTAKQELHCRKTRFNGQAKSVGCARLFLCSVNPVDNWKRCTASVSTKDANNVSDLPSRVWRMAVLKSPWIGCSRSFQDHSSLTPHYSCVVGWCCHYMSSSPVTALLLGIARVKKSRRAVQ